MLSLNRSDVRFKASLPDFCATQSDATDLFELIENSGDGAFSGKGVEQSRYFYPGRAGAESVANKGCRLSKSILVKNEPAQVFDFSVDVNAVPEGGKVRFTPERASMQSYTWYFGDGAYSREVSPWHYYYHTDATFDVRLEVKNSLGCTLSAVKNGLISVGTDAQGRYVQVEGSRYYAGQPLVGAGELEAVSAATGCEALEVVAFPNPVTDNILNISHIECVKQVEIYDLSMSRRALIEAPGEAISTASLQAGMYLVALKLVDGGLKVSKIVVK